MVKITALMLLKCSPEGSDPFILATASDLSSFGFFQRSSVREFLVFVGRTVSKRTPPGQRQSVQHEEYKVHSYNRNGLCALGFMDDHYPVRSAFSLLNQVLDEYQKNFGDSWKTVQVDNSEQWPYLDEALINFRYSLMSAVVLATNPDNISNILSNNTISRLPDHKTIDGVLERGVKLDSLVEKSSDLSAASQIHQVFYAVYNFVSCREFLVWDSDVLQAGEENQSVLYGLVNAADETGSSHLVYGFTCSIVAVECDRVVYIFPIMSCS
ncbi:UNVERIFIED_CONTAM: VAMP-like protein YKT61 [Sesamum angustifolium]|uniref:VAMP-like protein YKT61 n=1 Tax=Sesamum angustifolium TaxID=2727405 RepID=A0AAW2IUB6_9LAMI